MTPTEVAALDGIDLERGQKRLAEMGIAPAHRNEQERIDVAKANLAAPAQTGFTSVTYPSVSKACGKPCSRWIRRDGIKGLICDDCGAKKPKATRSDAGVPRPKPAQEPTAKAGKISRAQRDELLAISEEGVRLWRIALDAIRAHETHNEKITAFIDSITAD